MLSVKRHQMVYREKNKKNKPVVLNDAVKMLFRSEAYLEEVVEQMVAQADAVVAAQGNVWACCKALEEALSTVFPNCRAYPFGSRVSGLGNQVCFKAENVLFIDFFVLKVLLCLALVIIRTLSQSLTKEEMCGCF